MSAPAIGGAAEEANPMIEQQQPAAGREFPIPMEHRATSATPVYGSAQPTGGPAELLRRQAYARPDHDPLHWMLLLAADRTEVAGQLARDALTPGQQGNLVRHFARQARSYPGGFAAAAAVLGGALAWALARRRI
jgi:hypothetical protein